MNKIIILLLTTLILGCTAQSEVNNNTQIANPSAVYCEEQGYNYQIITNPDGSQSGLCVFSEEDSCDGWAYYRGECGPTNTTTTNQTIKASDITSDIDNALNEVNSIDVNDTGDAITPLTEEDLNTE